jgi:chromosome segregation ATPase
MLERDDEDLAIEQLSGAGRPGDHELAAARAHEGEPIQEQGAMIAEPAAGPATTGRLRDLRERIEQLQTQLRALPARQLERIDQHEERALTLSAQRELHADQLAGLQQPHRRLGRERDPYAGERARLTSTLAAFDRELDQARASSVAAAREVGDVPEVRAERDGLQQAITHATREHAELREGLADQELNSPGAWVKGTLGERPDQQQDRQAWEGAVRRVALYRADYDVTGSSDAIGPRPEAGKQSRDWERARSTIARTQRRLGREITVQRDSGLELER